MKKLFLLPLTGLLLAGCGQSGPLFMPPPTTKPATNVQAPNSAQPVNSNHSATNT